MAHELGKGVVVTVHDLRNPHIKDPAAQLSRLDALVPAADAVITLTQGAADAIITLGAKNEKAFENLRFIGLTKNKLALEGRPKSPHAELVLDGPAGRYLEAG